MTDIPEAASAGEFDWAEIKGLYDAALEQPSHAREAAIASAAVSDSVRAEVRSLLAQDPDGTAFGAGGFLSRSAAAHFTAASDGSTDASQSAAPQRTGERLGERLGERFGAWQIVAPLGTGGMGDVIEAERADGSYKGHAAVKVIKRGMDSAVVLQRFALERQALARLSHPHIATLLDAGVSADGLPYFVMELVTGVPIDRAVRGLSIEQRSVLFLQLTDAVAHAHRNLLVHRDLKPGNVLVTPEGEVKLLDFGIAKALDPLDAVNANGEALNNTTALGTPRPFTPNYASPEQVRGEPVSTATDIYSLGVLLYQLLTGVRPTGRNATTPAEAARSVLEEEPTRPSSLSADLTADPMWMQTRKRLAGDLDNILLKALEKTVERRYSSVDAFASDVRSFLSGHPVGARPASFGYLASRFIGRNRSLVTICALALLAVLGSAATALWQAHLAQAQRVLAERRFDEVRQFARTMLFDVDTALRDGPTAGREKLVTTSLLYLDRLANELSGERAGNSATDKPLLRDLAEAYERVGMIQGDPNQANLGRPLEARKSQDKALSLREKLAALAPSDLINLAGLVSTHSSLGVLSRNQGGLPDAAHHYAQAERYAAALAQARPDDTKAQLDLIQAQRYLSAVYYWPFHKSLGDYARARQMVESAEASLERLFKQHPNDTEVLSQYSGVLNQLTEFQRISGEIAATLVTQKKGHAVAQRLLALAPDNPRWQRWMMLADGYLADALMGTGDISGGIAQWQTSIALREKLARADPADERAQRNLANGYGPLAEALDALGRHDEALTWYQRENALLHQQRLLHPQVKALVPRLDESDRDLAVQLVLVGRTAEGVAAQRALDARRSLGAKPTDADEGKFALLRAQVLLAPSARVVAADEQRSALAAAEEGLRLVRAEAVAEPFNALLARELALGAHTVAVAMNTKDPALACRLEREASKALETLASVGKLPATVVEQRADAKRFANACPAS